MLVQSELSIDDESAFESPGFEPVRNLYPVEELVLVVGSLLLGIEFERLCVFDRF